MPEIKPGSPDDYRDTGTQEGQYVCMRACLFKECVKDRYEGFETAVLSRAICREMPMSQHTVIIMTLCKVRTVIHCKAFYSCSQLLITDADVCGCSFSLFFFIPIVHFIVISGVIVAYWTSPNSLTASAGMNSCNHEEKVHCLTLLPSMLSLSWIHQLRQHFSHH